MLQCMNSVLGGWGAHSQSIAMVKPFSKMGTQKKDQCDPGCVCKWMHNVGLWTQGICGICEMSQSRCPVRVSSVLWELKVRDTVKV